MAFEAPAGWVEIGRPDVPFEEGCRLVAEWMNAVMGTRGVTAADVAAAHGGAATIDLCVFFWVAADWKAGTRSAFDPETLRLRCLAPRAPDGPRPSQVSTAVAVDAGTWGPN